MKEMELPVRVIESCTRIYVDDMDGAIQFYERLFGEKCSIRFPYPEYNLELARVKDFLILAGRPEDLAQFRHTAATLIVDSVSEIKAFITKNGGKVVRDIKEVPTGYNLTMRHPDETVIEYVQFRPAQGEREEG